MLKLIHNRGRGVKAPAILARSNLLLRFGRSSRGYVVPIAGVVVAAAAVVSLLTWLAPNSDKPTPFKAVDRILPGVLEQVDDQVATLLGVDRETVLRNVREGLVAADSGLGRIASASSVAPPSPVALSTSSTAGPTPEEPSHITNEESSQWAARDPSPVGTTETSPPATQAPPPTTNEPPPTTEEPSPAAEESPPTEEPKPPTAEEPPPTVEEPPPATGNPPSVPPPATDRPLPPPTGAQ